MSLNFVIKYATIMQIPCSRYLAIDRFYYMYFLVANKVKNIIFISHIAD